MGIDRLTDSTHDEAVAFCNFTNAPKKSITSAYLLVPVSLLCCQQQNVFLNNNFV
jgi:hypothetical protein